MWRKGACRKPPKRAIRLKATPPVLTLNYSIYQRYASTAAPLQSRLLAPFVVAIGARCRHRVCRIENLILILGLRGLIRLHAGLPQSLDELGPVGIAQWNGDTVCAFAARKHKKIGTLRQSQCGVLHSLRSAI